jgi:hypothetical protein
MSNSIDQAPPLAEGDPVNNVVGTTPVLPQGGNTLGASTSHQAHGHGDDSSDSEDEEFDDARSNRSTRRPSSSRDYTRTSFDYSHLSFNHPSGSSHIGKIPQFDVTGYSKWKNSMEEYLMAVNPALWTIVNRGIAFPSGDATLTQDQANEIQRNYQAIRIIKSSLTSGEYDKVDGLKSAKEVWDTLFINHEGTKQVREGRIRASESELNRFVIKDDESPQDMYNRLNKITNKIKSLGSTRWGRREVVDKILSAYMARDVQLPTLIREKRGFNKFTPADVIGRMEEHFITVKESKLSQEMSKMHEQLEKNKGVALKASSKEKKSSSLLTVKIRQPSHEFTFGVGITFVSYSLVLTPVV